MNATAVEVAIRTEGLTKACGSFRALDHVDLEIRCGEVFGCCAIGRGARRSP